MENQINYKHIIGIDISKMHLDLCLTHNNKPIYQARITNSHQGFKVLEKKLKSLKIKLDQVMFCCENTGIYNHCLLDFIQKKQAHLWLENPLTIKKSLGLTRGKSDEEDAKRIATYAFRYQDKYKPWQPPTKRIVQLTKLWRRRRRLVKQQTQIQQYLTDVKAMEGKSAYMEEKRGYQITLSAIKKNIKQVEQDLKNILASDKELDHLHKIITSVDGVGRLTAIYLILVTEGFKRLNDPRKLACYAGVAPYPYRSGSSVKGRDSISPFANKELKKMLHLCAVSLLRMQNSFTDFVARKKKEGKHMLSILNSLRNKILHVVCACVRKNVMYTKNYVNSLG